MLYRLVIITGLCLAAQTSLAQRDKEDRKEEQAERKAANSEKVDHTVFRRQILTLPEFAEERRKLIEIRKQTKAIPKIYAVTDSTSDNPDPNLLTGYITLTLGDDAVNVYELTFDRKQKKIIKVKPTGEKLEIDKAEASEKQDRNGTKTATPKKKSDDDDEEEDDEQEEEQPTRSKKKDADEEDD